MARYWLSKVGLRSYTNLSSHDTMVIWLTGLSGSGKSAIGQLIYDLWRRQAPNTVMVDGDRIREILGREDDHSYTLEGRHEVAERIAALCAWLDGGDINVVCCTISLFAELHEHNRRRFSRYFEVYIDVPHDVLHRRDSKDLYGRAERGEISNVIGVDLPFTPPSAPDLIIDNSADAIDLGPIAADILSQASPP